MADLTHYLVATLLFFVGFAAFALLVMVLRIARAVLRWGWRACGRVHA